MIRFFLEKEKKDIEDIIFELFYFFRFVFFELLNGLEVKVKSIDVEDVSMSENGEGEIFRGYYFI